jgi:hypothetical protein
VFALAYLAAGMLAASGPPSGAPAAAAVALPDLDQEAPTGLVVTRTSATDSREWLLGFRSAVRNVGRGPLIIRGHRRSRAVRTMVADQVLERGGAPERRVRRVGRMRYVVAPTHRHWHLMDFDRYTLRRAAGGPVVRRDAKSGFCLGDRYTTPGPLLGTPPAVPRYTSRCGLGAPGRLRVTEGISVGYGDDYPATLEGQYLAIGGLPAGRYELTHRVNAARAVREERYDNDAASVLLDLRWRGGAPYLRVLARCEEAARCAAPQQAAQPVVFEARLRLHCVLRTA